MAPKKVISKKAKHAQGQSSSSTPNVASDELINFWMRNEQPTMKRFETVKSKKIHSGPFYNIHFPMEYRLFQLIERAGCVTLINYDENKVNINPLAIFLFFANLLCGGISQQEDDTNIIWTSVYGKRIKIDIQTIGIALG